MTSAVSRLDLPAACARLRARLIAPPQSNTIWRTEIAVRPTDPLRWLAAQPDGEKIYWRALDEDFEVAGVGVADTVALSDERDYRAAFEKVAWPPSAPNRRARYYGGFSFAPKEQVAHDKSLWQPFGHGQLILPRFELVKRRGICKQACNLIPADRQAEGLKSVIDRLELLTRPTVLTTPISASLRRRRDYPDRDGWRSAVATALKLILDRSLQKIVLARRSDFEIRGDLSPWLLLRALRGRSDSCYLFGFQTVHGSAFIGASPERLYARKGLRIHSEALAGTIRRSRSVAADRRLGRELLTSDKDRREHQAVVEFLDDAFTRFCSRHRHDRRPALRQAGSVQHLCTEFHGELRPGTSDNAIMAAIHPTPATAGSPRDRASAEISRLEPFERGWYAGPIGWVGADAADFAVGIRSVLIVKNRLSLFAGAGIVAESNPDREWDELEGKIDHFLRLFQ